MALTPFTPADLHRILVEAAGGGPDLTGDVLDATFADLGYDSLAVLETASLVSREFDVALCDDAVTNAATPRHFIELVNAA